MKRQKIACIDFDGTVVDSDFPKILKAKKNAFKILRKMKDNDWILILWTCREDEGYNIEKQYLTQAVDYCKKNGISFDGINRLPLEYDFRDEVSLRRKPYCTVFIDDRNLLGFPGWDKVAEILGIS